MQNLYVISGVSGMTGNELARQLLTRGELVIGFDNFFASSKESILDLFGNDRFSFYEYDLNNADHLLIIENKIYEYKNQYKSLIYINCAAIVHTEYFYKINDTFETNVLGMKSFLQQAVKLHANQFINCSTSEIYSMSSYNETGGVKESDYVLLATVEQSQRTSYATGKLLTEFLLKDAVDQKMIKGCSIRFANVYSKDEKYPKHIIPHIINSLLEKKSVELLENSKINKRTFLNNFDSCSAVLALSDNESALDGTVYNVATYEEISIIDLVNLIASKMNITNPKIIFTGYRSADPVRRILNIDKISEKTKWKPVVNLSEGLDMCISFYMGKGGNQ